MSSVMLKFAAMIAMSVDILMRIVLADFMCLAVPNVAMAQLETAKHMIFENRGIDPS